MAEEKGPTIAISGPQYEPTDVAWRNASTHQRRNYWRHLGELALVYYRGQLRQGIGANGRKLKAVKPTSRPDGAKGPPLTPHGGESRTSRYLAMAYGVKGATLWWRQGWSRILAYHQAGAGHLPKRDVLGLTKAVQNRLATEGRRWWRATLGYGQIGVLKGAEAPAAAPLVPAPKIKIAATGNIDLSRLTFGTGSAQQAEAAIKAGMATGFRRLKRLDSGPGGTLPPALKPRPGGAAAPAVARIAAAPIPAFRPNLKGTKPSQPRNSRGSGTRRSTGG